MLQDYKLPGWDNFILTLHSITRRLSISDDKALQLDATNTIVEQVPITFDHEVGRRIERLP